MTDAPHPLKWIERALDVSAREYYRRLREERRLATTRCERCRRTDFPPRQHCPDCGSDETWIELPLEGRLHAFTTQEAAVRFRAPAVLALAEVGDVVVPGIAEAEHDQLEIGQRVRVELRDEPETGMTLLGFRVR